MINCRCRILVRNLEGMGLLNRCTDKWLDNVKIDVIEIGCEDVNSICLAQNWFCS